MGLVRYHEGSFEVGLNLICSEKTRSISYLNIRLSFRYALGPCRNQLCTQLSYSSFFRLILSHLSAFYVCSVFPVRIFSPANIEVIDNAALFSYTSDSQPVGREALNGRHAQS